MKLAIVLIHLLISAPLFAKGHVDLGEIMDEIVWCGPHNDKALVCHSAASKKYIQICVSLSSLKKGHLTEDNRLHGDDYFGECKPEQEENNISVYPCNAGIKRVAINQQSQTTVDSTTNYGSYNDYAHAEITPVTGQQADNSYNDYTYQVTSVEAGNKEYNTLTSAPFTTMLKTGSLSFKLNSETYGTSYYVDWCITQTEPAEKSLDVDMTTTASNYLSSAELYSRYKLMCEDTQGEIVEVSRLNYEQMNQTLSYKNISLPASPKCIWRQNFIETSSAVRPNTAVIVPIDGVIDIR